MKKYFLLPTLFLGWLFVIYEYAIYVSNSVIVDPLLQTWGIKSSSFSIISAAYYLPYVIMQIPAGLLIDRLGVRRCWPVALATIAFGCYIFASSSSIFGAILGRMCMGFGAAFSWVSVIQVIYHVARNRNNSFYIGVAMAICMLGALFGQAPWLYFTTLLNSWQHVYFIAAFVGVVLCLLIYIFGHDYHDNTVPIPSILNILYSIVPLIRSKQFWILVIYMAALSLPQTVFATLWANEFLIRNYHITPELAASYLTLFWLGGLMGALFIGYAADKIHDPKRFLLWLGIISIMSMIILLYLQPTSIILITTILFILGFFTNATIIIYALTTKIATHPTIATTISITNMINLMSAAGVQLLVGWILTHTMANNNMGNLTLALSIIPAITLIAIISLAFLKKITH